MSNPNNGSPAINMKRISGNAGKVVVDSCNAFVNNLSTVGTQCIRLILFSWSQVTRRCGCILVFSSGQKRVPPAINGTRISRKLTSKLTGANQELRTVESN